MLKNFKRQSILGTSSKNSNFSIIINATNLVLLLLNYFEEPLYIIILQNDEVWKNGTGKFRSRNEIRTKNEEMFYCRLIASQLLPRH